MRKSILLAVLAAVMGGLASPEPTTAQLFGSGWNANKQCIDLKIRRRICGSCPFCWPCADIKYWVPKWKVKAERRKQGNKVQGPGGQGHGGQGDLHFFHVKVEPMTKGIFQQPCNENRSCTGGCLRPTIGAIVDHFYDSRNDPDWLLNNERMTQDRTMPPWAQYMMIAPPTGTWGLAMPRGGYVVHTSPLAASGLASLRGFNIARYPFDLWPDQGYYRLNGCSLPDCGPLVPNAQFPEVGPFPCMQPEKPKRLGCAAAGLDFSNLIGSGDFPGQNRDGKYTWVIWKHRSCTCPWPLGYCAEQLRGLGDNNRCIAPGNLGSIIREIGSAVAGEVRATFGVDPPGGAGNTETTAAFKEQTGSTRGQGRPPAATPSSCSRPLFRSCQQHNARVRAHNASLGPGERHRRRPLRNCGSHRSSCCSNRTDC